MRMRSIAVLHLALILPSALFMTALVVRNLGSLQYEPAHTAQQLVLWYAGRMWTLWVLLVALPLTVLVSGCVALRHRNRSIELPSGTHWASLSWTSTERNSTSDRSPTPLVIVTTVAAGGILAVVVLHMLAN
jgi:hypothetical protein